MLMLPTTADGGICLQASDSGSCAQSCAQSRNRTGLVLPSRAGLFLPSAAARTGAAPREFVPPFARAGLRYFNPRSLEAPSVRLGQTVCQTPEEFKGSSQNLGHDKVLTIFLNSKKWIRIKPLI